MILSILSLQIIFLSTQITASDVGFFIGTDNSGQKTAGEVCNDAGGRLAIIDSSTKFTEASSVASASSYEWVVVALHCTSRDTSCSSSAAKWTWYDSRNNNADICDINVGGMDDLSFYQSWDTWTKTPAENEYCVEFYNGKFVLESVGCSNNDGLIINSVVTGTSYPNAALCQPLAYSIVTCAGIGYPHTSIITQYVEADDLIRTGLIQTVIDNDLAGFADYVTDLGWNAAASNRLFSFIQRTAAPQLGPGLAFGQFERRSELITTAIINEIDLEAVVLSRNINLTIHGGISFVYRGIYEISVEFRQTGDIATETARWSRAQVRGLISDNIVGKSAMFLTGHYDSYNGFISVSFLINIEDEDDIYILEILRQAGDTHGWTLSISDEWFDQPDANIVVVVKNIGQL